MHPPWRRDQTVSRDHGGFGHRFRWQETHLKVSIMSAVPLLLVQISVSLSWAPCTLEGSTWPLAHKELAPMTLFCCSVLEALVLGDGNSLRLLRAWQIWESLGVPERKLGSPCSHIYRSVWASWDSRCLSLLFPVVSSLIIQQPPVSASCLCPTSSPFL